MSRLVVPPLVLRANNAEYRTAVCNNIRRYVKECIIPEGDRNWQDFDVLYLECYDLCLCKYDDLVYDTLRQAVIDNLNNLQQRLKDTANSSCFQEFQQSWRHFNGLTGIQTALSYSMALVSSMRRNQYVGRNLKQEFNKLFDDLVLSPNFNKVLSNRPQLPSSDDEIFMQHVSTLERKVELLESMCCRKILQNVDSANIDQLPTSPLLKDILKQFQL